MIHSDETALYLKVSTNGNKTMNIGKYFHLFAFLLEIYLLAGGLSTFELFRQITRGIFEFFQGGRAAAELSVLGLISLDSGRVRRAAWDGYELENGGFRLLHDDHNSLKDVSYLASLLDKEKNR